MRVRLLLPFITYALKPKPNIVHIVKRFSEHSSKAYMSKKNINFKTITNFPHSVGIRAYEENDDLIITARGSTVWTDWITNFNCCLKEYSYEKNNGKVHTGYLEKVENIISMPQFAKLEDYISKRDNINIYLNGHSSSCIVLIMSVYLSNLYPSNNFTTVLFGSPRIANSEFYNTIKNRGNLYVISVRFVDDIIPRLGIGINNSDKIIDIVPKEYSLNFVENHLMSRYEKYLIDKL